MGIYWWENTETLTIFFRCLNSTVHGIKLTSDQIFLNPTGERNIFMKLKAGILLNCGNGYISDFLVGIK